jgi:protein-S-isoprenylcysteine O-methyltransferase Ste14
MTTSSRLFAWAGGGVFVLSLVYFLFSFNVTFGQVVDGPASPGSVLWDVALFSLFALHHSLFARESVRRWVARVAPAGTERAVFVWTASLLLVAVCAWWQPISGSNLWDPHGPVRWLLGSAQISGILLAVGSAAVISVWELAGITPAPIGGASGAANVELKAVGPYRWVRHPIYSGWFLIVLTAAPMTRTRFLFAVVSGVYTLIGLVFEERSLRASSGGAYDRYARRVRWRLVPGVF